MARSNRETLAWNITYLGTRIVGWALGHEPRSTPSASGIVVKGSPWTARTRVVAAQFVGLLGLVSSTDCPGVTDGLIRITASLFH